MQRLLSRTDAAGFAELPVPHPQLAWEMHEAVKKLGAFHEQFRGVNLTIVPPESGFVEECTETVTPAYIVGVTVGHTTCQVLLCDDHGSWRIQHFGCRVGGQELLIHADRWVHDFGGVFSEYSSELVSAQHWTDATRRAALTLWASLRAAVLYLQYHFHLRTRLPGLAETVEGDESGISSIEQLHF